MRKKYAIIIVVTLVLSSYGVMGATLSSLPTNTIFKNDVNNVSLQSDDITISFSKAPLLFGVNLEIQNNGNETFEDVQWHFRAKPQITGTGLVYRDQIRSGVIDELGPNELVTVLLRPLGLGQFYINASVTTSDAFYRSSQLSWLVFFLMFNLRPTYMDIPPAEAFSLYENGTFDLIIDVVGLNIYSLGHLPGAVNYVWADGTLNATIPTLDKNLTYLVYCHTDPPSTASAQALVNAGFPHVYRLEGNYRAWDDAGYPTET